MNGRRTNRGKAVVGQSSYMMGKKRSYFVESWSAWVTPTGKIEPASMTLSNQEGGPSLHHIYCDQMQRLTTVLSTKTISIELNGGGCIEVTTEDEKDWRRWTKHIALLLSIPNYPIPEEPREVPLPNELLTNVDPKFYDRDGVMAWGLCVLQAGIGAKAGLKGALCVAVITDHDQVKIFPWKVTSVIIVWDRNKLRRSGSIGDLVFLEAGRRCTHGPGLLWMYTKSDVALSLREGLHTFLFKGNKEVAVSVRRASQVSISSTRSSGTDVTFDSGVTPESGNGSGGGVFCRQLSSVSSDTSASDSGIGKSKSLEYKPPVPLHSHPSLRRKYYSPPTNGSGRSFQEGDSPEPDDHPLRSQTMPVIRREHSQLSDDLHFQFEDESGTPPQHSFGDNQYVKINRSSQSPPKSLSDGKEYVSMSSDWLSSQSSSIDQQAVCSELSGPLFPQNQEKLLSGMNGLSVYDNHKLTKSRGLQTNKSSTLPNYDNVHIKPHWENYENTAITTRPIN